MRGQTNKTIGSNKWAIVIGRKGSSYPIAGDNSARAMASALRKVYGFDSRRIRRLINRAATGDSMDEAFQWLTQNTDGESSVFFFHSGHGYLSPIWLNQRLEEIKYERLTVVQEGCLSGNICEPMTAPHRVIIGSTRPGEWGLTLPSKSAISEVFIKDAMVRGLADYNGDGKISMQEAFQLYQTITRGDGTISDSYPNLIP